MLLFAVIYFKSRIYLDYYVFIASRYRAAQVIEDDVKETDDQNEDVDNGGDVANDPNKKGDSSSGRLFMKKFLLFKNMFGQKQTQPVIPIIITGGANDPTTDFTPTTTTITTTGSIPTATGTLTTSPITDDVAAPGGTGEETPAVQRIQFYGRDSNDNHDQEENDDEAAVVDDETLAAALAAGAEEYIVTDQEIKGTSDAKANRSPARINLRRRGAQQGQVVSVRVPPKYRGYFKNGQRVVLKTNNKRGRPVKRRVIKKRRINRRRPNKNKNKRRRVVA